MTRHTASALALLLVAGALWTGCTSEPAKRLPAPSIDAPEPTGDSVARLDDTRFLTAPVTSGNLTVWPVLADEVLEIGEFLTLQEAEKKGLAVVREVGAEDGSASPATQNAVLPDDIAPIAAPNGAQVIEQSIGQIIVDQNDAQGSLQHVQTGGATVGKVVIENRSDLPILVCGGTVVKGGQQDRQIGKDFVIRGKTTVPVDAFCIEQGRWNVNRAGELTGGVFHSKGQIEAKAVRSSAQYSNDQGLVWSNVAMYNSAAGNSPETGTLLATLEDEDTAAYREEIAVQLRKHFEALGEGGKHTVGFAYAIDGKPAAVRVFAHPRLLTAHLDSFAKTMALEADLARRAGSDDAEVQPASANDVLELVRRINASQEKVQDTGGANRNGLRRGEAGGNLNCYAELSVSDGKKLVLPPAEAAAGEQTSRQRIAITQDWTAADE